MGDFEVLGEQGGVALGYVGLIGELKLGEGVGDGVIGGTFDFDEIADFDDFVEADGAFVEEPLEASFFKSDGEFIAQGFD